MVNRVFLTNCWLIVEPPWLNLPDLRLTRVAPYYARHINAVMLVERGIFNGNGGVFDVTGDVGQWDHCSLMSL